MTWAHWVYFILTAISLLYVAHKHGEPKDENYNIFSYVITTAIVYGLLWGMGAFDSLVIP